MIKYSSVSVFKQRPTTLLQICPKLAQCFYTQFSYGISMPIFQRRDVRLCHRSPHQVVQVVMPRRATVAASARQTVASIIIIIVSICGCSSITA